MEVTLHTDGGSLVWSQTVHDSLPYLWEDIAPDRENEVVVLTGAGDSFSDAVDFSSFTVTPPTAWHVLQREGSRLLENLMKFGVPVTCAVNGPARVHCELTVMSHVVIASDIAVFADSGHFQRGTVPGDRTNHC